MSVEVNPAPCDTHEGVALIVTLYKPPSVADTNGAESLFLIPVGESTVSEVWHFSSLRSGNRPPTLRH